MNISIIGTGYVGLVQGACLADTGNSVVCMDTDGKKIAALKKGIIPIYESGLEEVVRRNLQEKRLAFTTSLKTAVEHGTVVFLCLPTPQLADGSANIEHVLSVADQVASFAKGYKIIVSKSTVPVGTVDRIRQIMTKKGKKLIDVVSNPEFLKEGTALVDSMKPDRIVIGSRSRKAITMLTDLFAPFVRTGNPIMVMDERSAEMTKYAANSFLATKISYMNELAALCEITGANIDWVRKGMGSDPRIGQQFLFAGVGYGGSCFPKDVRALIKTAQEHKYEFRILRAVDEVNERQKQLLVNKMLRHFHNHLERKVMAVWGLSFKPQTDDIREAPSLVVIQKLLELGAKVHAHDPIAMPRAKLLFGRKVDFYDNCYDALKGADALAVVTEWNEFRRPDFDKIKLLMRHPVIFDGRNIYEPEMIKKKGFVYFGVGRDRE